ncbi:pimeloyl-ACP methyl ester carboxylesterase [Kribbella steppae]|uniref:Pimeloyl-ACP methyl ester carboxylesterase n=1 Tax=Kribbella steppae TaxID=2512223 RepID=A0A4R2HVT7_9ACTN|nr:alpha/beta hydrolase [Kribbella steppae]TCO35623.1 pimeloyl-ACP methyl ester carboxylesterase [Kribbella steppae]
MTQMTTAVGAGLRAIGAVSPRLAGRVAFELWRRPMARGQVRSSERAVYESARIEVVDGIVTYAWGDGQRPVLLVHGWRSRASRYAGFITRLLELGYSPISYDGPGHGDTTRPMGTILDHQRIITRLAARYGDFEGLIAHSLGVPFALYAVRQGVVAGKIVSISGFAEFGYLVDKFGAELGLGTKVKNSLRREIERQLFGSDPEIWTKYSVGAGDADLLVIHNDVDDVVDPSQVAVLLASYGPQARFSPKTGLGHGRILSDPAVIEEALAFLAIHSGSDVAEGLDLSA